MKYKTLCQISIAVAIGCVVHWLRTKDDPGDTGAVIMVRLASPPSDGIQFTPRYPTPDPSAPEEEVAPGSGVKKSYPWPKLKRPMTNDGLRHGGILYIGPVTYHPPKPGDTLGTKGYVKYPPGYKGVHTNVSEFNLDILVVPKTPEDYAREQASREHLALQNKTNNADFDRRMRASLARDGATPEETEQYMANAFRHLRLIESLGTENYTNARRSAERNRP